MTRGPIRANRALLHLDPGDVGSIASHLDFFVSDQIKLVADLTRVAADVRRTAAHFVRLVAGLAGIAAHLDSIVGYLGLFVRCLGSIMISCKSRVIASKPPPFPREGVKGRRPRLPPSRNTRPYFGL